MRKKRKDYRNVRIDKMIRKGFVIVIAMAVVLGLTNIMMIRTAQRTSKRILNDVVTEKEFIQQLERQVEYYKTTIYKCIALGDVEESAVILEDAYTQIYNVLSAVETYALESGTDKHVENCVQLMENYEEIKNSTDSLFGYIEKGDVSSAFMFVETNFEPHFEDMFVCIENLEVLIDENMADVRLRMLTQEIMSISMSIILLVIMLVLSRAVAKTIIGEIAAPMKEIEKAMNQLAEGDFSAEVNYESTNEIGVVAKKIKETISTIQKYIGIENKVLYEMSKLNFDITIEEDFIGDFKEMQDSIEKILVSMNQMFKQTCDSAEVVDEASDQVASVASVIASSATEQAASVEELVATIHQITDDVTANAKMADNMNENAQLVNDKIEAGKVCMDDLKKAMTEIIAKSKAISEIIDMINDIADQTNLLSINASIEAAHAGELGKGFGVVANEIGKLANQCAKAVRDTEELVRHSISAVEEGSVKVDESINLMEDIVVSNSESTEHLKQLSDVCNQQAAALQQTLAASNMIAESVQENTGMAQEASASSEELKAQAMELHELFMKCKLREEV